MISVVIPVYNVAPYLRECLDSVIQQTYTDLQIIIIDDGSTDESGAICDAYAAKDARIQVVHQENRGLSAARNRGIELAAGEYLSFVDSDDYLLPDCMEALLNLCIRYDADMSVGAYYRMQGDQKTPVVKALSSDPELYTGEQKVRACLCDRKIDSQAWAKLFASEIFENIRFPEGRIFEDTFVIYKLAHTAKKIVHTSKAFYVYRKRPHSITTSAFSDQKLDSLDARFESAAFIAEHYPHLLPWAQSKILLACTGLLDSYTSSGVHPGALRSQLQALYRKYLFVHLKHGHNRKSKLLAMLAYIDIRLAEKCALLYRKLQKR